MASTTRSTVRGSRTNGSAAGTTPRCRLLSSRSGRLSTSSTHSRCTARIGRCYVATGRITRASLAQSALTLPATHGGVSNLSTPLVGSTPTLSHMVCSHLGFALNSLTSHPTSPPKGALRVQRRPSDALPRLQGQGIRRLGRGTRGAARTTGGLGTAVTGGSVGAPTAVSVGARDTVHDTDTRCTQESFSRGRPGMRCDGE